MGLEGLLGHPPPKLPWDSCDHLLPSAGYCSPCTATAWCRSAGHVWTPAPKCCPAPFRGGRTTLHPAVPTPPCCRHEGLPALGKGAVGPKPTSAETNQRVGSWLSTLQPGGWWRWYHPKGSDWSPLSPMASGARGSCGRGCHSATTTPSWP